LKVHFIGEIILKGEKESKRLYEGRRKNKFEEEISETLYLKEKETHKMGRGNSSKSARKTQKQMARGKIHGKLLAQKGHRVTKKMANERRELNKALGLSGRKMSNEEFQNQRIAYHSENPSNLHNKSVRGMENRRELIDNRDVYVLWETESLPESHPLRKPFTPCDYHKKFKFPKSVTEEEIIEYLEGEYHPLKVENITFRDQ
jgi:hypothetical protein